MIAAAGILIIAPSPVDGSDTTLMLLRGGGSDHPFEWCFPGGHVEAGESTAEAAARECEEECGLSVSATALGEPWMRALAPASYAGPALDAPTPEPVIPSEDVVFTTYVHRIKRQFTPTLCDEHVGWCWSPTARPPGPTHPGPVTALAKLTWHELDLAKAMAAGQIMSPVTYENVTLFSMRVTGTGIAYRRGVKEFVWRGPSLYLNDEFLQRCNGLPVIWVHPPKATLDFDEYNRRNIGSVFLPFIKGEEVWAICKVYDASAIEELKNGQLSTSPTVVFRDPTVNERVDLTDGSTVLVEGIPSLLDHVAVCGQGVWDQGSEPAGVDISGELVEADAQPEPTPRRPVIDADTVARGQLLSLRARTLGLTARNY